MFYRLQLLVFEVTFYSSGVVNLLSRFLRESSLRWFSNIQTGKECTVRLTEVIFSSICVALCESRTLEDISLRGRPGRRDHRESS